MMQSRRHILAALALLGPMPWVRGQPIDTYKYRDTGRISKRDDYQARLLALALEKTVATDGPYALNRVVATYSPRRMLQEMSEGKRINIFVGTGQAHGPGLASNEQICVPFPIFDALLGYRHLIMRKEDEDRFSAISTLDQLKRLRAGQGHEWLDARILRHNGFRVDDSGNLDNLLPMLHSRRFDYVPMSIVEVQSLIERHPDLADQLMIAPGIAIQYTLPSVFFVSKKFPALAARLERGLLLAKKDGSFDHLLRTTFRKELQAMAAPATRRFTIVNPFLSDL